MSNPYAAPNEDTSSGDIEELIAGDVRVLQIVTGALIQGAVVILVIMLFMNGVDMNAEPDVIAWVGIGFAVMAVFASFVLPGVLRNATGAAIIKEGFADLSLRDRITKTMGNLRTLHIVTCALLEGPSFLNSILYASTNWIGNAVTAAVLILLIIFRFPTKSSMPNAVRNRMSELEM